MTAGGVTEGRVTVAGVTEGRVTEGPVTEGPVTEGPVTEGPVTEGRVTEGCLTEGCLTEGCGRASDGRDAGDRAAVASAAVIRRAVLADVPALRSIAAAAYLPYEPRIGRAPAPVAADYAAAVARGETFVIVDGAAGIVGLIVLVPEPQCLLLENVALLPSAQGRGLGTQLLNFADAHAADLGLPAIRLYTNEAMTENLTYYPRRGYVETHRAEEDGFRRVFFRKTVTASGVS